MNKDEKKRRLEAWKLAERARDQAALPLDNAELGAMFDHVDAALGKRPCDHSRVATQEFLQSRGHDITKVFAWLDEHGGFCDCEVAANARQHWQETTRPRG